MKRNLLYLAGFLLAAATVFSGCNDDDPSYHDLIWMRPRKESFK